MTGLNCGGGRIGALNLGRVPCGALFLEPFKCFKVADGVAVIAPGVVEAIAPGVVEAPTPAGRSKRRCRPEGTSAAIGNGAPSTATAVMPLGRAQVRVGVAKVEIVRGILTVPSAAVASAVALQATQRLHWHVLRR